MDNPCTASMTTTRTDTTHRPTYSMARVVGLLQGFICRCHCFYCC